MKPYDLRPVTNGARFATDAEFETVLEAVDLTKVSTSASGLPLKSDGRTALLSASGENHNLIIGSTGSGKSRRLTIPMLMSIAKAQQSSVVVTDVKGELYRITSGLFKAQGYKIQVINLRDPSHSNGWSILHRASDLTKRGELDRSSELLSDFANVMHPENTKAVDPFWSQTARQLLTGLAGLVCEAPEAFPNMSMWTVQNLCNTLGENSSSRITAMDLAKELPIDSVARNNLSSVLLASDRTLANILVSYAAGMSKLYTSRPLTMMLSTPDIVDFAYIGRERTALYIILPDEKTTLHGIASMIINQAYASLIEYAATSCENERLPVHVDFVLDEFSNLPSIPDMAAKISAGRSRNISFTIIVQGLKQIEQKYGNTGAQTIMGNCSNWVFLNTRQYELLQTISRLCGTNPRTGLPLISTSQLQRLDKEKGEALVLCGRLHPYISTLADLSKYQCELLPPVPLPSLPPYHTEEVNFADALRVLREKKNPKRTLSQHNREVNSGEEDFDLQTALEARFDELFGPTKKHG